MRIPSTPRRAGARNKPTHFTYVSAERGQPFEAYLAGPVWWGYLHMSKPSKPCVYELTAGQVACRFCTGKFVPVVKGWVPLYRRIDGLAVCVPVDEALRDELDALKPFTKVAVGRGKGRGVGVWVRACLDQLPEWSSTLPERNEPADITESLIRMWAVPEVVSHFGGAAPGDTAVSLQAKRDEGGSGEAPATGRKDAAPSYARPGDGAMLSGTDEAVNRLLQHARKFGGEELPNGKPKPKG